MGKQVGVAVTLLAAVLLAGCGDPTNDPTGAPPSSRLLPTPEVPAPAGPGSAIADDLVVPAGAQLLGRAFPDVEMYLDSRRDGWKALLVVEGDGRASFDALRTQAQSVGYELDPRYGPGGCDGATCAGTLVRDGQEINVETEVSSCGPVGASHLTVQALPAFDPAAQETSTTSVPPPTPSTRVVSPPPTTATTTDRAEGTTASTAVSSTSTTPMPGAAPTTDPPPAPPPDPSPAPPTPGAGDLINEREGRTYRPVHLVGGSITAGRALVPCDENTTALAVLVVGDDVDTVVDAYAGQFAAAGGEPARIQEVAIHGSTVTKIGAGGNGSWWYMRVVESAGQPTFALVQSGIDT